MGWMRKPLALLLCACMALSCAPASLAAGAGALPGGAPLQEQEQAQLQPLAGDAAGVPVARFDFGSEQSPVAAGWTKATPLTAYDAAAGYGWKNDAR
ncbi:MAG: hypothetical protein LBJ10_06385, partial [Clostridiales bacterium]|nr:hypothetical protein [Clostridiales bacterium]